MKKKGLKQLVTECASEGEVRDEFRAAYLQMENHGKFMAQGKCDTAVEGQEVSTDDRAADDDGREEMKWNGWRIMWVDQTQKRNEVGEGGQK